MCFYFQLSADAQTLENRFKKSISNNKRIGNQVYFNAFEHPHVPVVLKNNDSIQYFEWGLIPNWAKNNTIQKHTLNARIETLHEKPSFKNVLMNRCIIPATGFYEWQWLDKKGKNKQRFLIQSKNVSIFCFAGLTSEWVDITTGEVKNTFTIVTTQANELMSKIHNTKQRMPVILKTSDENAWLNGEDYTDFAFPYSTDMIASEIS